MKFVVKETEPKKYWRYELRDDNDKIIYCLTLNFLSRLLST